MRFKIGKVGLLFLVLVIALASVGAAFAAWTDTVTFRGTVDTGEVCWQFASATIDDDNMPPNGMWEFPTTHPDLTCNPGFVPNTAGAFFWPLDKNVGWGEVVLVPDADGHNKRLDVTLHNTYPCYFNEVAFYLNNCGDIPIKVWKVIINGVAYYAGTPYAAIDCNGDGEADVEISWNDNFGTQYEPGTPNPSEYSFWIHVLQPAPQNATLRFTIELWCVQWNEYVAGPLSPACPTPPPQEIE